jgi:hypothetical protein
METGGEDINWNEALHGNGNEPFGSITADNFLNS